MITLKTVGLKKLEADVNKAVRKIHGRTQKGLNAAAVKVKGDAMRLTPRDLGNLVNSAYIVWPRGSSGNKSGTKFKSGPSKTSGRTADISKLASDHVQVIAEAKARAMVWSLGWWGGPVVEIGYSAYYSIWVHEIPFTNYTKPGTQYKYLETAVNQNRSEILKIIAAYSK